MKSLKEFLLEETEMGDGSVPSNEVLFEVLEEISDVVLEDNYDEHRWYTASRIVAEVIIGTEKRYFSWAGFSSHGDGGREDNGWTCPKIDDIKEMYPHKVMQTDYFTLPQEHQKVLVNKDEWFKLQEREGFLLALESAGVDNWEGYSDAQEINEEWGNE